MSQKTRPDLRHLRPEELGLSPLTSASGGADGGHGDPEGAQEEHLTTDPDVRIAPGIDVDPERGLLYCTECDLRITKNTKNGNEYGHDRDCSHHQSLSFSGREVGDRSDAPL